MRSRAFGLPSYYLLLLIALYIPIGVLFLMSFNDSIVFTFPLRGLTTRWYEGMAGNTQLIVAVRNSALVALVAATLATALGTCGGLALARYRFPGKTLFVAVALLPLIVPFLLLAVSLLILLAALDVQRSLLTVMVAHTVVAFPYALLIVTVRLVGFERSLEEAARDLGASYAYTLRRVIVPLIAPAMLAAWLVAFTVSFDEFILASFTIGRQPTLPVYIFGQLRFANRFPQVVALAVLVMVTSVTLVLVAERLQRRASGFALNRTVGNTVGVTE